MPGFQVCQCRFEPGVVVSAQIDDLSSPPLLLPPGKGLEGGRE
jgi:hypothetical protein